MLSDSQGVSKPSLELDKPEVHPWRHPGGKLVEKGPHSLKQDELLAVLIGSGVPGRPALAIANAILDEYVGLYGIQQRATIDSLARIPGLGRRKAERILAAIELGRRLHRASCSLRTPSEGQGDLFSGLEEPQEAQRAEASDAELLTAIIGSGVRGQSSGLIAQDLIEQFESFLGLFGQDMGGFLKIRGLNSAKTIRIVAALEIAKRVAHALS